MMTMRRWQKKILLLVTGTHSLDASRALIVRSVIAQRPTTTRTGATAVPSAAPDMSTKALLAMSVPSATARLYILTRTEA